MFVNLYMVQRPPGGEEGRAGARRLRESGYCTARGLYWWSGLDNGSVLVHSTCNVTVISIVGLYHIKPVTLWMDSQRRKSQLCLSCLLWCRILLLLLSPSAASYYTSCVTSGIMVMCWCFWPYEPSLAPMGFTVR